MNVSERGIELIKEFEGLKLKAYQDSVGIWTIGYGSTSGVTQGMEITQEEADERLRKDLEAVEKCLSNCLAVKVTQNEYDALASFIFNLGCRKFINSTLLRKLNSGSVDCGPEFDKWCFAGARMLEGLVRRRKAERELFES